MRYLRYMLSGFRIYSSDIVWRQILADLNATVLYAPIVTELNLDTLVFSQPISCMELKELLISAQDKHAILNQVFGRHVSLSNIQAQLVSVLFQSGGMRLADLKDALGYAPNTSTHAIDMAIYQLRKTFGHDFIVNNKGVYRLGRI